MEAEMSKSAESPSQQLNTPSQVKKWVSLIYYLLHNIYYVIYSSAVLLYAHECFSLLLRQKVKVVVDHSWTRDSQVSPCNHLVKQISTFLLLHHQIHRPMRCGYDCANACSYCELTMLLLCLYVTALIMYYM